MGLRGQNPALEARYDQVLAEGRNNLAEEQKKRAQNYKIN